MSCSATRIKDLARDEGFDRVGITTADPTGCDDRLTEWLEAGYAGTMDYLHRHREQRLNPRALVPGARSVICVAVNYHQPAPERPADGPTGRVARYAWGRDYHKVIKKKLRRIVRQIAECAGGDFVARIFVDSAPIMERVLAARAGVGWIGKNGLVLHETTGSYLLLGEIVTSAAFEPDGPATDHCGTCRRCLDACPTGALVAPRVLDARRCISYATIEHRGEVPAPLRASTGDRVFGCDACQEACPYNRRAPATREPDFAVLEPGPFPDLVEMLLGPKDDGAGLPAGSALRRATVSMLGRNAAVALGNVGDDRHREPLRLAAEGNDALIINHARWALGRLAARDTAE